MNHLLVSILLVINIVASFSYSIGTNIDQMTRCSKYEFEEKILQKVMKMENKLEMELLQRKMDDLYNEMKLKLEEIDNSEKERRKWLNETTKEVKTLSLEMEAKSNSRSSEMEKKVDTLVERGNEHIRRNTQVFNNITSEAKDISSQMEAELRKFTKGIENRPVFFASLTNHYTLRGTNDVLKFDDVRINVREGYKAETGEFTAPLTGTYVITCVILSTGKHYIQFQLNKNSQMYISGHVARGSADSQTLHSYMVLQKGDRVYIKHRSNANQQVHGGHYSNFGGYLLSKQEN